ncbi:hypothetical protein CH254_23235 [Rhodococcus sp. 06-412-2C]|uniref:hypothetical protein n=1 Tax=unclassified Rhodococcus (in: high G+C Gram-positive bacteria) TaxID=192944 RepID=UPI000B9B8173|nr:MULTISPECIES: hypothetical protein [unclassified Rhodococcus (in: high G+C Gram-positive bacteria)]OZC83818.1 hypothetical protein CH254_23235 [Rhodococcus sp. 06-412-2C]OZC94005.1 hypothetical protein CH279_21315 [Rhodococcus sp. 06-412-2B]
MAEEEMDPTSRRHRPARPQPPRPDVVVEPLRPRQESTPSVLPKIATALWASTAALVLALAAAIALNWESVLAGVEIAVSQQDSTASSADVRNTASATLLSSGAASAVLVLLGFVALNLLRGATTSSKVLMGAVGILTIGAAVTFSTFVSDAPALLGGVLQWGPFVVAGTAVAAVVVALIPRR